MRPPYLYVPEVRYAEVVHDGDGEYCVRSLQEAAMKTRRWFIHVLWWTCGHSQYPYYLKTWESAKLRTDLLYRTYEELQDFGVVWIRLEVDEGLENSYAV